VPLLSAPLAGVQGPGSRIAGCWLISDRTPCSIPTSTARSVRSSSQSIGSSAKAAHQGEASLDSRERDSRCDRRRGYLPYPRGFSSLATSAGIPSRFATTAKRSFS
jgi:hypothetical protein